MKKFKRIICVFLVLFLLFSVQFGCVNSSMFTEEQHLERISKRVNKKVLKKMQYGTSNFDGQSIPDLEVCDYEGFEIYPLYNENEEFKYALIEFKPYGFAFVSVKDSELIFNIRLISMYCLDRVHRWYPQTKMDDGEYIYQYDENGEIIFYKHSPYYICNSINKRKYLIYSPRLGHIPAIKEEDIFINLISGEPVDMDSNYEQPYLSLAFYFKRKENNL